jgi:hypothetical protein
VSTTRSTLEGALAAAERLVAAAERALLSRSLNDGQLSLSVLLCPSSIILVVIDVIAGTDEGGDRSGAIGGSTPDVSLVASSNTKRRASGRSLGLHPLSGVHKKPRD